jgi:hypothetical protein
MGLNGVLVGAADIDSTDILCLAKRTRSTPSGGARLPNDDNARRLRPIDLLLHMC